MNIFAKLFPVSFVSAWLCLAPLTGCHESFIDNPFRDNRESLPPDDSWSQGPNTNPSWDKFTTQVKDSEFCVVAPNQQVKAIQLLQKSPLIPIDKATANLFCQNSDPKRRINLKKHPNARPYLVRGVFLNQFTGGYYLLLAPNALWVSHGSLGHHPVKMTRQALVVYLRQKPNKVYVTCGMSE